LANQGHSERPAKLHGLDVFADDSAFPARQRPEPFAHRLVAGSGTEESGSEDWLLPCHESGEVLSGEDVKFQGEIVAQEHITICDILRTGAPRIGEKPARLRRCDPEVFGGSPKMTGGSPVLPRLGRRDASPNPQARRLRYT